MNRTIPKFVLTGGPCGFKTTLMDKLAEVLPKEYGINPIFVPEAATKFITQNILNMGEVSKDPSAYLAFQHSLLDFIVAHEREYTEIAEALDAENKLLIFDRAFVDCLAYMPRQEYEKGAERVGKSTLEIRDQDYDAIFFLRSVAYDASQLYDLKNPARFETPERAKEVDTNTALAWLGHPHLRIIDNAVLPGDTIEDVINRKLDRLIREIVFSFNNPNTEIERKYLVSASFSPSSIRVPRVIFKIEQPYFLPENGVTRRLRTRTEVDAKLNPIASEYLYSEKSAKGEGMIERTEVTSFVNKDEYQQILAENKPVGSVLKYRHVFVWENQIFELDQIIYPKQLFVLEIELSSRDATVTLPPFIDVIREVTEDPRYANSNIAISL